MGSNPALYHSETGGIGSAHVYFRKTVKPLLKNGLEAVFMPVFDLF
jgi:hypothetical protein